MKVQNKSKQPVILGAVHNGRFEEGMLVIHPGQVVEMNEKRLDYYDPNDLKALREVGKDVKVTPPALSIPVESKKPALEDTEIAEQELMKTLAAANNVGAQ